MIKPFVSFVLLLMLMVFAMAAHILMFPYEKNSNSIQTVAKMTHLSPLSLSVAYDESSFNTTYPEMPALGRMDFVYER